MQNEKYNGILHVSLYGMYIKYNYILLKKKAKKECGF